MKKLQWHTLVVVVVLITCSLAIGDAMTTLAGGSILTEPPTPRATTATPLPQRQPDCHTYPKAVGPPLPLLDSQFSVGIEATLEELNYTIGIDFQYDYPNNQASILLSNGGSQYRMIFNFPHYEAYYIHDKLCHVIKLRQMRNSPQIIYNINYINTESGGHVTNVDNLFNLDGEYNHVYVKSTVVRGIPVDHWVSCVHENNVTYRQDYFFSKQNYTTPSGKKPVPVRAIVTTLATNRTQKPITKNITHVHEFFNYKPGPCDASVFRIPHDVVCTRAVGKKTQPTLPDHFSMGLEVVQPMHNLVTVSKQYFDYGANLSRTDITPSSKVQTPMGAKYGHRPLKVIHDYSTGIQYVIDELWENCSIQAIPNNSIDARTISSDPTHVHMRHGADMFWLNTHDTKYQGQRTIRGVTCDVWAAVRPGWLKGVTTTMESCWIPKSDIDGLSNEGDSSQMVLVQIALHSENKTTNYSNDYISNVYNYHDDKPDLRLFNIGGCFSAGSHQMDIIFRIPGTMLSVIRNQPHHFQVAVRKAVSVATRVSPIRVNSLFFEQTSPGFIAIWMTIYDSPEVEGNVDAPVPYVSLPEAYRSLERAIDSEKGLVISLVSDKGSKSVTVARGSLKVDKDINNPQLPFAYCNSALCTMNKGHSSGSMAALGIVMLLAGLALGLLSAFIMWKRSLGIPYQLQD